MPKSTSSRTPKDSLLVTRYAVLDNYVRAWAAEKVNLLLVIGPPGRGKTTAVTDALQSGGVSHGMIAGRATAFRFYCECFQHKDSLIVLDDADPVMNNKEGMAVVKSLTDTKPIKTMRWNSKINGDDVPSTEFDTNSRVCVLANIWSDEHPDYEAVANRGTMLFFTPNPEEIFRRAEPWADPVVLDAVRPLLPFFDELSLRLFRVAAEQLEMGGREQMEDYLRTKLATGAKGQAIALLLDKKYRSDHERAKEFRRITRLSERTFYRTVERLRQQYGGFLGGEPEAA